MPAALPAALPAPPPPSGGGPYLRGAWLRRVLGGALAAMFCLRLAYFVFEDLAEGRSPELAERLFLELTGVAAAAPFLAALVWLGRRVPLARGRVGRALAAYVAGFVAFTALHTTLMLALRNALGPALGFGDVARFTAARYAYEAASVVFPFAALAGGLALAEHLLAARERERREAALERSLLEAELRGLRLQLQPHFLFNALNTISSTMYDDPAAADEQLSQLAELLRTSLRTTHAHEVPLGDELALLGQYLGLTRARFGDRLAAEVRAAPDVHDCLVPSMLLQPLVENAVRHGALASRGRGRVTVAAERAPGGRLVVRVHDDGPGAAPGVEPLSAGTGLSATARRLRLLYGDAHALHAGPAPEGGFEVRVVIPARAAGGPAGARAGVPGVPDAVSA